MDRKCSKEIEIKESLNCCNLKKLNEPTKYIGKLSILRQNKQNKDYEGLGTRLRKYYILISIKKKSKKCAGNLRHNQKTKYTY